MTFDVLKKGRDATYSTYRG